MTKIIIASSLLVLGIVVSWAVVRAPVTRAAIPPELILFSGEDFTGYQVTLTGTVLDMPKGVDNIANELPDWNDSVGSIIVVSGTWRLYQHGRCNSEIDAREGPQDVLLAEKAPVDGWSCVLSAHTDGSREYPRPSSGGWSRDVSSVELVSVSPLPEWAVLKR